jgi:uncharacterized protein
MTQMRIRDVASCKQHRRAIIVLEDTGGRQELTFYADLDEARRLVQQLQRGPTACHPVFDFIRALLEAFDTRPTLVVLEDVHGHGVGANVHLRGANGEIVVPCYPPDALSLALRAGVPVYATPEALRHTAAEPGSSPPGQRDPITRWLENIEED